MSSDFSFISIRFFSSSFDGFINISPVLPFMAITSSSFIKLVTFLIPTIAGIL